MFIGPGIAGRRFDGLRVCGNSFRVPLGEKVHIPGLQKVAPWGVFSSSCRRRWHSGPLPLEHGEFTPQAFDFLQGGLVLVLEVLVGLVLSRRRERTRRL